MKSINAITAVLLAAVASPSLLATPGVTPISTSASGSYIGKSFPTSDPTTSMKSDERTVPGSFGGGASAERGAVGDNRFTVAYTYSDKYFVPSGPVDYIQLKGSARALSESTTLTSPIQATATSFADAYFTVTEPVTFRFTGSISTDQITAAGPGWLTSIVGVRFYVSPGELWIAGSLSDPLPGSRFFEESGVLAPGQYTFETYASVAAITTGPSSSYQAGVSYDIKLEFTAIPAPGALPILGLPGLLATRRRR
ncbi:MAG: hypothetical protein IT436_03575 [Phycisphaerales bacterium]|nr:hypothetical protein [Phycisphaerales bacterium]